MKRAKIKLTYAHRKSSMTWSTLHVSHTHTHTIGSRFLWQIQDSICVWLILILQNRRWDEAEIKRDVKIYKRKKSSWIWQKALETTSRCKQVWCVPWIFCVSGCTHIMLLLLSKSMPVTCFPVLLSDHLISFICSDWWFSAPILHSVTISQLPKNLHTTSAGCPFCSYSTQLC